MNVCKYRGWSCCLRNLPHLGFALSHNLCIGRPDLCRKGPRPAIRRQPAGAAEKETWKAPFGGTFTAGLRLPHRLFLSRHLPDPAPGRRPGRRRLRDPDRQREPCRSAPMSAPGAATSTSPTPAPSPRSTCIDRPQAQGAAGQAHLRPGLHPLQLPRRGLQPVLRLQRVRPGRRLRLRRPSPSSAPPSATAPTSSPTPASPGTSGPRSPCRCPSSRSTRTSPSRSSARRQPVRRALRQLRHSAPTTTGTGSSAPCVTVYGFDLTVAYIDTNVDVAGLPQHPELPGRIIFAISKTF